VTFEKYLPTKKKRPVPKGIMVRPDAELMEWLSSLAQTYNVSVNALVLAMLKDLKAGPRIRGK
jgi:predicted HicB family RNase H-like nuclease